MARRVHDHLVRGRAEARCAQQRLHCSVVEHSSRNSLSDPSVARVSPHCAAFDILEPVVKQTWACFDVEKSTIQLVYAGGGTRAEIILKGLNEYCPSNPLRAGIEKTWAELEADLQKVEHISDVKIISCKYDESGIVEEQY